ncbi:hypothetical protein DBR06_SOUSAS25910004, partial [Sousa chinensis]
DHLRGRLVGNVYVKFWHEEDAAQGVAELDNHWFNSQTVHAKLSPVTDFWEPCCRQMREGIYGGFCNFVHCNPSPGTSSSSSKGRDP